jgi:hypothetical protein
MAKPSTPPKGEGKKDQAYRKHNIPEGSKKDNKQDGKKK